MEYYRRGSHTVYDCTYHVVWITKYRYKVLVGDIGRRVKEIVQEVCKNNNVEIIRGRVASNHVHVYVSIPPYQSVSKLVQLMKGKSSRKIQQEFPELRKKYWGRHFWAVGYFVRTTGNVTDKMIKDYIEKHAKKDDNYGDFQVEN